MNHEINQKLIDMLIESIPTSYASGRSWNKVLWAVKNASQYIQYDPTWFLVDWSPAGEGFDEACNRTKWAECRTGDRQFAPSVAFLRGIACKFNIIKLRNRLYPIPPIGDRNSHVYYIDHESLKNCPVTDKGHPEKYLGPIKDFVRKTIALVHNGGQSLWVTKNLYCGEVQYTLIPRCKKGGEDVLKETQFVIDWVEKKVRGKKELQIVPLHVSLLDVAKSMSKEISYSRLDFLPYSKPESLRNPERAFNQFTGLVSEHDFTPRPREQLESELEKVLYQIREILCNGDIPSYNYLMHWLAHTVQRPEVKIGVTTIIRSQEGAGKSCFWEWFGKFVIGEKYYLPARMNKVVKQFNAIAKNNLFTLFEETKNGEGHKAHEDLKTMITDPWQVIEPKGIDSYKTRSYSNYVILTNEHYPVKLTANDKRFFCLDANNRHKADREYWTGLRALIDNPEVAPKYAATFYEYLQTFDLTTWDSKPVETQMRRDLKAASLPLPTQFLLEVVRGNIQGLTWEASADRNPLTAVLTIHTEPLYNFFRNWEQTQDIEGRTTQISFSRAISEIHSSEKLTIDKVRKMGYHYIRGALIDSIRTYLNDPNYSIEIETEELDEVVAPEPVEI